VSYSDFLKRLKLAILIGDRQYSGVAGRSGLMKQPPYSERGRRLLIA
jgi:hypothetical protein